MGIIQPPSTSTSTGAGYIRPAQQHVVEVGDSLGQYEIQPYMYALSAANSVAPAIGRATIAYNYGNIKRADKTSFSSYEVPNLNGKFIRIRTLGNDGTTFFIGVIDVGSDNV